MVGIPLYIIVWVYIVVGNLVTGAFSESGLSYLCSYINFVIRGFIYSLMSNSLFLNVFIIIIIIMINNFTHWEFFTSMLADSLSQKTEWQQVSSSFQDSSQYSSRSQECCCLDWHYTSQSSSPIINPLVTEPKAPITISISVTFMFDSFLFNSPARSR